MTTNRTRLRKYGLVAAMVVVIVVGGYWGTRYVVRELLPYAADQGRQD
jgi:hypothetical protein